MEGSKYATFHSAIIIEANVKVTDYTIVTVYPLCASFFHFIFPSNAPFPLLLRREEGNKGTERRYTIGGYLL
jgi:hypothetical protein